MALHRTPEEHDANEPEFNAGAAILYALGDVGNHTEADYDPAEAARRCDALAAAARRLAHHYRTGVISKAKAAELFGAYHRMKAAQGG